MDSNTSNTLIEFRRDLYGCLTRAGDALMNAADALLTEPVCRSFAELSLSPLFQRRWPSLYEAFQDARIDREALRRVFAARVEAPQPGARLVIGGDASSIARPQSPTARDRTYVHQSNLPEGCKPVTPGWQFSTLAVLPYAEARPSSWTYVLDNRRIQSEQTQGQVMAEQLREVVPLLPGPQAASGPQAAHPSAVLRPLFLADAYYSSVPFLQQTQGIACDKLTRLARNRVLYRPAPPRTGKPGAPRKDGEAFKCHDPATHGPADAHWEGEDAQGHRVEVDCWNNLHFRDAREIIVQVLRVTRPVAQGTKRDPRVSWFLFEGVTQPPLAQIPALYALRYSLEHGYRVDKQDLLWASVRLRTPEQFQCWTDVVAAVRNQLCLARAQVQAVRRPWEKAQARGRPATPQQVRRAMARILAELGTPARLPQTRGKSPGRPLGAVIHRAPRFAVVYKDTGSAPTLV